MRGNPDEALASLERALALNPSDTGTLVRLSRYYMMTGRGEEAVAIAERNVRLDPLVAIRHTQLANRRISNGDIEGGLESFERSVELSPQNSEVWQQYIGRTRSLGAEIEAFKLFARMQAVEDPPMSQTSRPNLLRELGLMFFFIGDSARAREILELALRVSDSQWIHMDLGGIALADGRYEDAWRETWLAAEGDPSNDIPATWLTTLAIARGTGMDQVLTHYRRQWPDLFLESPEVTDAGPDLSVAAVRALRHTGDDAQADRILEAARGYVGDPDFQDQEHLAGVWVLLGDDDRALSALEKHVEEGGDMFPSADYAPTIWAPIADDPRFIVIVESSEEKRAAKRAEVDAMIERGELVLPTP